MQRSNFELGVPDGTRLHVNRWLPDGAPRAIVQIAHGMAEHSERYARFAQQLAGAGYAVYANDHRGHGKTARQARDECYYADQNGFETVVQDLHRVTVTARTEQPGLPLFLVGHSMGSFLSRSYAATFGYELTGLVLIGTAGDLGILTVVGRYLAQFEGLFAADVRRARSSAGLPWGSTTTAGTRRVRSSTGSPVTRRRWTSTWPTRSAATSSPAVSMPTCSAASNRSTPTRPFRVPKDLPIHLVSGSLDPVGNYGKGVVQVAEQYIRHGVSDVTTVLWDDARHEVLNETNRDDVTEELLGWLEAHLPAVATGKRGRSAVNGR